MHPSRSVRRAAAATLAAGLVLGLTPVAHAQVSGVGPLRVSQNQRLGADQRVTRGRDVPGLAVNPTNPSNIVEVDVDFIAGECDYNTSFDGGRTWGGGHLRAPAGFPVPTCEQQFDSGGYAHGNASVEFGSGQNVYTTYSSHRGRNQRPESNIVGGEGDDVLVNRSSDGGRTFEVAAVAIRGGPAAQPYYIRPQLAVERGAGAGGGDRIYLSAWGVFVTCSGAQGGGGDRRMVTTRSDDGGRTWTAPVDAQRPGEQVREPAQPVVASDGTVYIGWENRDIQPFAVGTTPALGQACPAPVPGSPVPPNPIVVARSTDRGATWERFEVGPTTGGPSAVGHPRLAVDRRTNTLYVTYLGFDFAANDADVVFRRSTDRGQTWSAALRVNDDRVGNLLEQRNPWVSVAPDGRVDIVWLDPRNSFYSQVITSCCAGLTASTRTMGDIYMASSTDGGRTFGPNRRITDRTMNRDVGLVGVGGYTWYGAVSVSLDADRVMVAWTDSREGNFNSGAQDVYIATVNIRGSAEIAVRRVREPSVSSLSTNLSRLAYPGGVEGIGGTPIAVTKVVVVPDGDVPAAVAGAVLARANLGPLLVSPSARLTPEQRTEVARLEPAGAFVVGDEGALSAGVVADLVAAGVPAANVKRLAGGDAAGTARLVAEAMDGRLAPDRTAGRPAFDGVVIVNPAFPGAAAAAAGLAAAVRLPVLMSEATTLPRATTEALAGLNITSTLVVGDPAAVGDGVLAQLPGARRLGGTSVQSVSEAALAEGLARGLPTNMVYVADTERPLDAAMVAAAVGRLGGLELLVPGADPGAAEPVLDRLGLRPVVDLVTVVTSQAFGTGAYRLVAGDGGLFSFGAPFLGSLGAARLARPVVGAAATPSGKGYWMVGADGGVFAFGEAPFLGSTGALRLAQPVVGMAATPSGKGYWMVASDGGVFAFGDAPFVGSTGALRLAQPIVAIVGTPSGKGYWLVASDGGVFAFGDAVFRGSTGAVRLARPVVGASASPTGRGYWLVASDGGVFGFGDAAFQGSTGALRLVKPVVGMTASPSGRGYWLVASDGGVFAFGDAAFRGSTGALRLASPIVGIAPS